MAPVPVSTFPKRKKGILCSAQKNKNILGGFPNLRRGLQNAIIKVQKLGMSPSIPVCILDLEESEVNQAWNPRTLGNDPSGRC